MQIKGKTTEKAPGSEQGRAPKPDDKRPFEIEQGVHPALALQRAKDLPASELSARDILALQRTIGNRAVQRLLATQAGAPPVIQTKLMVGAANDHYEQEADRIAQKVTSEPSVESGAGVVQRQTEEDEPVQRMALAASITPHVQRQPAPDEDECIQTKRTERGEGFEASGEIESRLQASRGSGSPLPDVLRSRMERGFGTSFENVRIHTGDESDRLNNSLQSRAFTTGQDLYFKRGEYNPESQEGQKLIAHELTHVIHQNGGSDTHNNTGVSSGKPPTIQRLWWLNPRNWCGSKVKKEESKPDVVAPSQVSAPVTSSPAVKATETEAKQTERKVEEQRKESKAEDDEFIWLRSQMKGDLVWVSDKSKVYDDPEALRFILENRKLFASKTKSRNNELRSMSFEALKNMQAEDIKQTGLKQKGEEKKKEKEDKQRETDLKTISDNKAELARRTRALQPELKSQAEALGVTWNEAWDGLITTRRNLLDDNRWYKTATVEKIINKAGEIIQYVSRDIAKNKAETLAQKMGEKGLGLRNQQSLSEKAKKGAMTLTKFSEEADAAIKRQGKLSMEAWKSELKFTDYSEGPQKLNELKEFETHLTLDENSFKEPVYAPDVAETPDTIMEKLLNVQKEFQIHVTVSTGHRDTSGAYKNPHMYWFYENAPTLMDKDGNLRYSAPLTEKDLKDHMTKELRRVKASTSERILRAIDIRDTTDEKKSG